ncbi:MAG TPA: response regulator transcription factor [Candidatus Omnitrophota bacterium]|nr:response regulator transcription factor [Candidatus Omnitrophota bacterium]
MKKVRIVLADDHEIFREGLKSLIARNKDYEIIGEAKNGEELLDLLDKKSCDLAIVDLSMPVLDGMEALQEIKKEYPTMKVLILTMQKDHEHFKHARTYGADGYLLKEDTFEQLNKAIRTLMKGKSYVSPSVEKVLAERFLRAMDDVDTPSLDLLTKRELQILKMVAEGLANKTIAAKLKISVRTVETHRNNLTNRLGIKTTAGLVRYAVSKGLV